MSDAEEKFKRRVRGQPYRRMKAALENGELREPSTKKMLAEFDEYRRPKGLCPRCGGNWCSDAGCGTP